jgi:hypothetical protein
MIGALRRLQSSAGEAELPEQIAAFGISGRTNTGFAALFCSHPPLDQRIAALEGHLSPSAAFLVFYCAMQYQGFETCVSHVCSIV